MKAQIRSTISMKETDGTEVENNICRKEKLDIYSMIRI